MRKASQGARVVHFGVFEANLAAGELWKSGVRIKLQEQPFHLLEALLERPGAVITREELRERLWPEDTYVDFDRSLNTAASRLREALGDSASSPRFVETLPRRGYRFVAPVEGLSPQPSTEPDKPTAVRRFLPWALLAAVLSVLLIILITGGQEQPRETAVRKFAFSPEGFAIREGFPAISPDGTRIACATGVPTTRLWIQDLDQPHPRAVEGTENARRPFWSPGSDLLAFVAGSELKKADAATGAVTTVCQLPCRGVFFSGTWSPDGASIVFGCRNPSRLFEVPARGGEPVLLIEPAESEEFVCFNNPYFLPAGPESRILAFSMGVPGYGDLVVQDLDTGVRRELEIFGSSLVYSPSGHLLYRRRWSTGTLWALPFSIQSRERTGEPFPVAEDAAFPTVAADGTLVYRGEPRVLKHRLTWRDRDGDVLEQIGQPWELIQGPAIAPDQNSIAFAAIKDDNKDVWVLDLARAATTRVTHHPRGDWFLTWSPSGDRIATTSGRTGNMEIFVKAVEGSGEAEQLVRVPGEDVVNDWSSARDTLLYYHIDPETNRDIWEIPRMSEDNLDARPLIVTPFNEHSAALSAGGRWLAYVSDKTGKNEVYVRPYPQGPDQLVSQNGGTSPRWRRDGRELYYVQGDTLVAVPILEGPGFSTSESIRLFSEPGLFQGNPAVRAYDAAADGQRFAVVTVIEEDSRSQTVIRVVENWYEEFRERQ